MRYLLLLLLLTARFSVFAASETPEQAAEAFYRWALSQKTGGLPSLQQRKQLEPYVIGSLLRDLTAASEVERQCVAVTPQDMKPPIWEGNIFVGNYEGATEAAYGEPYFDGLGVAIKVHLLHVVAHFPSGDRKRTVIWQDTVKLRNEKRRWVVADVIRNEEGSLAAELRKYVQQEGKACRQQAVKRDNQGKRTR